MDGSTTRHPLALRLYRKEGELAEKEGRDLVVLHYSYLTQRFAEGHGSITNKDISGTTVVSTGGSSRQPVA
jgi:hypothetical protein